MTRARVFVEQQLTEGGKVELGCIHYLGNVLRKLVGDQIYLVNGGGQEFVGVVRKITRQGVRVEDLQCYRTSLPLPFRGLIFPPIQKTEIIAKMATELGVTDFFPCNFQRTQAHYNALRFEKNIREAVEQSERLDFPRLHPLQSPTLLLSRLDKQDTRVFFCQERCERKFTNPSPAPKEYALVGPAGGFTSSEIELVKKYPFCQRVSLSPHILRSETACAAILSLMAQ
jgi:RsmE family RNA methyltransferase